MSKILFEGSSDSETEIARLKTNEDYAKSYNKFRQKELLKKLKDRDKNGETESSSEDGSESSEDEFVANKQFDEEFYKTLSLLKSKNPEIYKKDTKFFQNMDEDNKEKRKKQKAMTIRDYERKVILEKGGKFEDDSNSDNENQEDVRSGSPSYVQEQMKLKSEIKKVLDTDDNENEEFGGIFRKREKTREEKLQEEEEFAAWLTGKKEKIDDDAAAALNPLKKFWSNPSLTKQEQFLRDYVLNNGYENKETYDIPTYEEVVADCSDDEKELEKQEEFEHKFNFRFEDPDQEFIKRYPRTINISVRKIDERRKEKRLEVKERKLKEKEQKFKEIAMLKEMKRKEIQEKIEKLKEVTGNEELPFKEEELNEDFDPEAHDRRMREIFNAEYYEVDEGEEKPECPEIEELKVEDWDNFDPKKEDGGVVDDYEVHCEDENFNMDCDYDPETTKQELQNELIENTKSKRKRRRRNHFMDMIKKEKPPFNPDDEITYGEYIEEYYKMDCEDIIGDTPCRFKYVETEPNDFGLTLEEILLAKNKELNQWVSLKKAIQIRPKQSEIRDRKLYRMKAKNEALKRKIFTSIYGPPSDEENGEPERSEESKSAEPRTKEQPNETKKKKKRKKKKQTDVVSIPENKQIKAIVNDLDEHEFESQEPRTERNNETEISSIVTTIGVANEKHPPTNNGKKKKKIQSKNPTPISSTKNGHTESQKTVGVTEDESTAPQRTDKAVRKSGEKGKSKTKTKLLSDENKQRQKKVFGNQNNLHEISDDRLKAYGLNPRKFRKQMNYVNRKKSQKPVSLKKNKFKQKSKKSN